MIFFFSPIYSQLLAQTKGRQNEYKPPKGNDQHPNQTRKAGGTRKEYCNLPLNDTVTLLVPQNHVPTTVSEKPTFFWYVPKNLSYPLRFTLIETGGKTVFVENISSPKSGINALKLPLKSNALEVGKTYRWTVTVVCSFNKPSRNLYASALIERLPKNNDISDTAFDLAEKGIWYDALLYSYSRIHQTNEFWSLLKEIDLGTLKQNKTRSSL